MPHKRSENPQLAEIARVANVAVSTALRVLSGRSNVSTDTTERVLSAYRKLSKEDSSYYAISPSRKKKVISVSNNVVRQADVARLAKVGSATVSRALNGDGDVSAEKMSRILAAATELRYLPDRRAQTLRGRSSGLIGMILPGLSGPLSECAESVESVITAKRSLLAISISHNCETKIRNFYRDLHVRRAEGMIVIHAHFTDSQLVEELSKSTMPIVVIRSYANGRCAVEKDASAMTLDQVYVMGKEITEVIPPGAQCQNPGRQAAQLLYSLLKHSSRKTLVGS